MFILLSCEFICGLWLDEPRARNGLNTRHPVVMQSRGSSRANQNMCDWLFVWKFQWNGIGAAGARTLVQIPNNPNSNQLFTIVNCIQLTQFVALLRKIPTRSHRFVLSHCAGQLWALPLQNNILGNARVLSLNSIPCRQLNKSTPHVIPVYGCVIWRKLNKVCYRLFGIVATRWYFCIRITTYTSAALGNVCSMHLLWQNSWLNYTRKCEDKQKQSKARKNDSWKRKHMPFANGLMHTIYGVRAKILHSSQQNLSFAWRLT